MVYTEATMPTDNSTPNYVRLTVRVDKEVTQRLKNMAAKLDRSLSSLLRDAITGILMFEEHPEVMESLKGMPDVLQFGIAMLATSDKPGDATDSIVRLLPPSPQTSQQAEGISSPSDQRELSNNSDQPL